MLLEELVPGILISVYLPGEDTEYKSRVVELLNPKELAVLMPVYKFINLKVKLGMRVKVVFNRDESDYAFYAVIIKKPYMINDVWCIDIKLNNEIAKDQERAFYRIPEKLVFNYYVIDHEDLGSNSIEWLELGIARKMRMLKKSDKKYGAAGKDDMFKEVVTNDISGNGLSIESDVMVPDGTKLDGTLFLDSCHVSFVSEVVRNIKSDDKFIIALRITDISEVENRKLLKYIFSKQNKYTK